MLEDIKNIFKKDDSYSVAWITLGITFLCGMLAYHILCFNSYGNADCMVEGLAMFHNWDWEIFGCGRWLVRYTMAAFGNLIIPFVYIVVYIFCVWLCIMLLKDLWDIKSNITLYMMAASMIITPSIVAQLEYYYLAISFCTNAVAAVLYVYFNYKCKNKIIGSLLGAFCITWLLALYQSYIGMAAVLVIMTMIIQLIRKENIKDVLFKALQCVISACIGGAIYFVILDYSLKIYHLEDAVTDRLGDFNLKETIVSSPREFLDTYRTYFNYFVDEVFKRQWLYLIAGIIILFVIIKYVLKLVKEKDNYRALFLIILFLLIPPASNVIGIVAPYYEIYPLMNYQNCLLIPFALFLMEELNKEKIFNISKAVLCLITIVITWTYMLSSNATFRIYEMAYNQINSEMTIVLDEIYHTEGYKKNKTPIIMAGFPNVDVLKNTYPDMFRDAINFPENPVFWEDMHGATVVRKSYFANYLGVDAKDIDIDEYYRILKTDEFKNMNTWPSSDSVKTIDGYTVVKFVENPPMPY